MIWSSSFVNLAALSAGFRNRPYKWLAEYYDLHVTFHVFRYESARQQILGKILPRVESACDLACGTGTTAAVVAQQGIKMFGVDLSPTMCKLARQKTRQIKPPVKILRADMRDFVLPKQVGLILCEFDALNHVPEKAILALVARAASRALLPGGHFYFDVNNRVAFQKLWPGTLWSEKPGVALVLQGGYDQAQDRGWINAEWFFPEGRLWRRRHERIEQVCWSSVEVRKALREAGFDYIRAWDATLLFKGDNRIEPGCRTSYLARKSVKGEFGT
jgi:SAM-dependent methyltransferase